MSDVWIGLCEFGHREELRRVLMTIDAEAILSFAENAIELRQRVQQAYPRVGAIIGDTGTDVRGINIAAALVSDAMANDVVLVVEHIDDGLRRRATGAGVEHVVDASSLACLLGSDIDEPALAEAELPTILSSGALVPDRHEVTSPEREDVSQLLLDSRKLDEMLPSIDEEPQCVAEQSEDELGYVDPYVYMDYYESQEDPMLDAFAREYEVPALSAPLPEESREEVPDAYETDVFPEGEKAPIITFVSGRGGVGKTTVVATMAAVAATWDLKVALLDLDLSYGDLYNSFGLRGPADISGLADAQPVDVDAILACGRKASSNIELWGPCELPEMAETISPLVRRILRVLSHTHDVVLVDTATACTDGLAQAMQMSDRLVLVVDDRPGAAVAQARMGALAVRLGVARTRIVRLANRCGQRGKSEPVINRADVGLETARPLRVLDGGVEVVDCLAEGKVAELLELGTRYEDSVANCLAKLLSELGALPELEEAKRALEDKPERHRWSFGLRREAV
ncbi:MAG: P-loop NTPase [Coriobacteriales bacterium]|nr:P-loop NTPase [Coriobacteriales bacterium]